MHTRVIFFSILLLLFVYSHFKIRSILPKKYFLNWLIPILFYFLIVAEQFIYRYDQSSINSESFLALFWVSSFVMGLWACYIMLSMFSDLFIFGIRFFVRFKTNQTPLNPERRLFLTQGISWGVLAGAGGISGFGLNNVLKGPEIQEVIIPIPHLPSDLDGFRIAQISDLHVGPTILKDYVENVVKQTMSLSADLIAVTGDLVDGTPESLRIHTAPLSKLSAAHGVFYVTGNHEYYWDSKAWLEKVKEFGFKPLMNENVILNVGNSKILLGGVTDTSAEMFEPQQKTNPLAAILNDEKVDYKILLAHRPDSCFEASGAGFDLQLSGHTHAGQFFPFNFFVSLAHKYYKGLNRHENMWVYVNSGTGYWGPVNRFAIPAEITLIKLKRV